MKEKVLEIINNIRAAKDMAPVAELHIEDNLRNDLGLTSFDLAGFKSWCPTISARGKIRFNSRSSASNEAFCSSVRVSAGKLAASSPPS